jgi:opacity protein-like surface antigen
MKKLFLIALCGVLVASSAFAASPIRMVGFEAGYVSPDVDGFDDAEATWIAGAFMDFGLPAQNLYVSPFVNYWDSNTEIEGGLNEEFSVRDITFGANLKFTIPTQSAKFQPYIAGGIAAHMLSAEFQSSGFTADDSETKFGFQLGGGFNVGVSERTSLITSGWYNIVEDVNNWSLRAGLGWSM